MSTMRRSTRILGTATLVIGLAGLSSPAPGVETGLLGPGEPVRGSGTWQRDGGERAAPQRWSIDLTSAPDGRVEGAVTLDGSRLAHSGRLRGTITGRRIRGAVSDEAGNHLATFYGLRAATGTWHGSYEDRTGEIGRWSWDGKQP